MVRKIVLSLIAVLGICAVAMAQNQQVSGTVTDAAGAPVAGATVMVDGTTVGTTTSADGAYSISVPREGVLLVTFIGYEPQRYCCRRKTRVNVVMKEDTQAIDDVIVVAYGTAKKEAFTGSASVMKAEDIGKRQVSNISNALAGAVAGVQAVSSNGQPGESAKIRIRGIGSMSASSAPLYIVDGAPLRRVALVPEQCRYRVDHGAEGCRRVGHLRCPRCQRRRAGHHQARQVAGCDRDLRRQVGYQLPAVCPITT